MQTIWLVEYAKRGNKLVRVVRVTTETLQGIPSIVYGLFGMLFFVTQLNWGYSLIAGAFTLAIMVLPVIMRTTEEALIAVPDSYREGSFGLGAGKLRTVFTIVLPSAMPGILSGIILATGRIVGETAALIYTASFGGQDPRKRLQLHPYAGRPHVPALQRGPACERNLRTAVVLLVLVLGINCLSSFIARKLAKHLIVKKQGVLPLNKFEVKNMDLYYGSFHALKDIKHFHSRKRDHRVIALPAAANPPFSKA